MCSALQCTAVRCVPPCQHAFTYSWEEGIFCTFYANDVMLPRTVEYTIQYSQCRLWAWDNGKISISARPVIGRHKLYGDWWYNEWVEQGLTFYRALGSRNGTHIFLIKYINSPVCHQQISAAVISCQCPQHTHWSGDNFSFSTNGKPTKVWYIDTWKFNLLVQPAQWWLDKKCITVKVVHYLCKNSQILWEKNWVRIP